MRIFHIIGVVYEDQEDPIPSTKIIDWGLSVKNETPRDDKSWKMCTTGAFKEGYVAPEQFKVCFARRHEKMFFFAHILFRTEKKGRRMGPSESRCLDDRRYVAYLVVSKTSNEP